MRSATAVDAVAYWAHVGGFITGVLLICPFTMSARGVFPDRVKRDLLTNRGLVR